jgi:hypothetical protein
MPCEQLPSLMVKGRSPSGGNEALMPESKGQEQIEVSHIVLASCGVLLQELLDIADLEVMLYGGPIVQKAL